MPGDKLGTKGGRDRGSREEGWLEMAQELEHSWAGF